jgi:hypothetical protein
MTAEELESLNGDFQLLMDFFILHGIIFDIKPVKRDESFSSVSVIWGSHNMSLYDDTHISASTRLMRIDMNSFKIYSSKEDFSKAVSILSIPLSDIPLHLLSEDNLIRLVASTRIEACL